MALHDTIDVRELSVHYHGHLALKDINFSVDKGQLIGIIGPNGAGKSTLIKAILGLEKAKGNVRLFGETIKTYRKQISYVPQRNSIDWDFPVRVEDVVMMGRFAHIPWYKRSSRKDREMAKDALEKVGMSEFSKRQIGELSGGQQQRVFIARALAQNADVFFLDEPFVGIDMKSEEIIVRLLHQLRDSGKTIFVVHHDLSKVEKYFDQLILLNQELISAGSVKDVYTPEFLKRAYQGSAAVLDDNEGFLVVSQ
ncbi:MULTISPECIES: metal ABC transporter ATP-binding protein [Alteribacter]|uniref:Metal ABC transporter ATP-binding protein n=1 Tax=Alteribacter keqinensis TaxID=2483800 RepID=A0A3M7TVT8_9BACI|nr:MULTISPECIES: metal ABC transporter ATP-binding protein [Alteribacter]MBM7097078.1 metal ABC transporter ATP-binding protein [Alteribacter salitolerans]RNA68894.1 metal ABC transporter ATP-binding protein [Alteribacter keqinensis]